jgi:uncharacterized protein (DUF1778 family)
MASSPHSPNTRLDFRVKPEHKSLIERAASVEGQTVTDFAVATLVRAAHETIERAALQALSARDSRIFLQMLASDAPPNAALKAAARRYKKMRG